MKPLFTELEFSEAHSRAILTLECITCGKPFGRTKNDIQRILKGNDHKRTGDYCCTSCSNTRQRGPVAVVCLQCGHTFMKKPCHIARSPMHFCSRSCAASYHNARKVKGTRVSKLEVWLQRELTALYPSLEIRFNRKDAIDSELDIYIPSLRLAFELNGIFHYEPVYGPEKLGQIQNNDCRKQQACNERGIALCVIDVSGQKYFKEKTALPFLEIIVGIIAEQME